MHFFKYLFLFLFFFSSYSYAQISQYYLDSGENPGKTFSSKQAACNAYGTYNAVVTSDGTSCFYAQIGRYVSIKSKKLTCPSATEKNLKVPTSAGSTVCVANCSYRLTACVDVPEEPGMTCGAISTGGTCGSSSNTGVDQTTGKAPTAKDTPQLLHRVQIKTMMVQLQQITLLIQLQPVVILLQVHLLQLLKIIQQQLIQQRIIQQQLILQRL